MDRDFSPLGANASLVDVDRRANKVNFHMIFNSVDL